MTQPRQRAGLALLVLFGINLMNFFDRQIAAVVGEPVRLEFGLSDTDLGILGTVFTLVYAAVGVPLGRLTDSWSRTRLVSVGVTFWSILTAASGLAWNYPSIVASRIGVGIGEASCAPACQSLIGDLYPPERRARAMGIFMLGLPLGLFAAYILGGIIGQKWGWRAAFYVAGIPGLLFALLMLLIPEPARGTFDGPPPAASAETSPYRAVLSIPTMWWIILSGMLFNFNSYAMNIFQVPFLQRFHEVDLKTASIMSAISLGLSGTFGLLFGGWAGDKLRVSRPNGRVLLPALALLIAAPLVYVALEQPKGGMMVFTVLMAISTALSYVYYSTVYTAIQDVVAPQLRGTAVSLYFFGMYVLGASFGSTVIGKLSDRFAERAMLLAGAKEMGLPFKAAGLHSAMYVIPVLMLACAGSLFLASRTVVRDMQKRAASLPPAPLPALGHSRG
jgi:predicted MFS family arabinose efflux permease